VHKSRNKNKHVKVMKYYVKQIFSS